MASTMTRIWSFSLKTAGSSLKHFLPNHVEREGGAGGSNQRFFQDVVGMTWQNSPDEKFDELT
jgi:hypothetical protein